MIGREIKSCPVCGVLPVKEAQRMNVGGDGGYELTFGRYICPKCRLAPSWGKCYCVEYGFGKKEIKIWNEVVDSAYRVQAM